MAELIKKVFAKVSGSGGFGNLEMRSGRSERPNRFLNLVRPLQVARPVGGDSKIGLAALSGLTTSAHLQIGTTLRNKTIFMRLLIFLVFLGHMMVLSSCNSSSPESAFLKFDLEKGRTYSYTMNTDMENERQGIKTKSEMKFDYEMEVTDDKDGIKTLKCTYTKVVMGSEGADSNDIDTDKPAPDSIPDLRANPKGVLNAMFHAIVGKGFIMKVDAEGRVTEVNGLKEMSEAMLGSMNLPEKSKADVRRIFSAQFNEEVLKSSFSQAFNIFPNKAVKVGDSWDKTINLPGMVKSSIKYTFNVKSITDTIVTLGVNAGLEMGKNHGVMEGTMVVDRKSGLITNGETSQKFEGKMASRTRITGRIKNN